MSQKEKYALDGVVVSLNTPFDEHDRIDFRSLERLVEYHLEQGASGLLVPAQAAEVLELSLDERRDIIRCVRQNSEGHAQLIAGATASDEGEILYAARAALAEGCDGILVDVPGKRRGNRDAILEFFESFAVLEMPMLMIQDLDWTGSGLDLDLIVELFERIEAFSYLKVEVIPAGAKYSAVLKATGGRLHVAGGWASNQLIESLDRGVSAIMPTAMTGLFVRVFEAYRRGNREEAKEWFHRMLPVLAFTRQHLDTSIHFHKRLFHERGIFTTHRVRKNTVVYDENHERYGLELIAYLDLLEG
jgi:dihydrodipicolinate synthase/N-acetylneuraminate lyase